MAHDERPTPHYLRFAQALAFVSLTAAATATTGCSQVGQAIGCEHCACGSASIRRPVSCSLVGNDYCCQIIEGPLAPPDLAA